jgi:hypothetical protein
MVESFLDTQKTQPFAYHRSFFTFFFSLNSLYLMCEVSQFSHEFNLDFKFQIFQNKKLLKYSSHS